MNRNINWMQAVQQCQVSSEAWALVTVIHSAGSTPRETGSKMVVTKDTTYDTIGGGQLEFNATQEAKKLIFQNTDSQLFLNYPLAAKTNQCCGGSVAILIESFAGNATQIELYGAGHVAKELIHILARMDVRVDWVDNRAELFPEELPTNVRPIVMPDPTRHISKTGLQRAALIMTHDHALDYRLTQSMLDISDYTFVGLIGSKTKAMRFKKRLKSESFTDEDLTRLKSPVGLLEIPGKKPIEIAISVAGQLVQLMAALTPCNQTNHSHKNWQSFAKSNLLPSSDTPETEKS